MEKETKSFLSRCLSVLPQEQQQAEKVFAIIESVFCIGCSLMSFAVLGCFPVTATTIVLSFMLALIGFLSSVGIAFESGFAYWCKQAARWKHHLSASIAGLILGSIAIYFNVDQVLERFVS